MKFRIMQNLLNDQMILQWRGHKMVDLACTKRLQKFDCYSHITVLLIIFISAMLLPPCSGANQGWVLTQRSRQLGDQYVYLSGEGLKCINPKQGFGLITQAPNWHIELFNNRTRLYYTLTLDAWKKKLTARLPANIAWSKTDSINIAGLRATHYVMHKNASLGAEGSKWLSADYWVADDIRVPPQLANMLSTVYGLPTMQFVPLRLAYTDASGKVETILDTYQQQSAAIPASYFATPAGFSLAKSEMEIMVSSENRQLVNDIARDLARDPSGQGLNTTTIPAKGVTLPNGRTLSKQDISKYLNAFKQRVKDN